MEGYANGGPPAKRAPIDYAEALEVQQGLVAHRQAGRVPDTLWLLEHSLSITWGSSGKDDHLRCSRAELLERGVGLHRTKRGGDVTCHEPGQLVGYPIVWLAERPEDRDLHRYLRRLEQGLIRLLGDLGLEGRTIPGRTGVWLDGPPRKIVAIGVRCERWVTSHGFAFNVENSLEGFGYIVPCGIADAGVTTLARELGPENVPSWNELERGVHARLEESLERPLRLLRGAEALRR